MGETPHRFEELTVGAAPDLFKIAPERGGIVTELTLDGVQVLYLDRATFDDPARSVRGGIPVLFPICGPLRDDRYALDGRTYAMKQHGFARSLPWQVVAEGDDHITLSLESSDATRSQYPFEFAVRCTYRIGRSRLRIEHVIENRSKGPMPFSFGFHPYFSTPDKDALRIEIPAHHAAQNPFGQPEPFHTFDFDAEAIDVTFTDAHEPAAHFDDLAARHCIRVSAGVDYRYLVFWTLRDKPFCCLEPWTARGDALNTGLDLIRLEPGRSRALTFEISRRPLDV